MANERTLTSAEYVARQGGFCPACDSGNIQGGPIDVDAGSSWQECCCQDCDAEWHDDYVLTGFSNLVRGQ